MTTARETGEDPARFCSNSSWMLTASDGPDQTSWFEGADDDSLADGVDDPTLGTASQIIDNSPPAAPLTTLADPPRCLRNRRQADAVDTFRIKFTRAGKTKAGDRFYQYHIHYQIKEPYAANTERRWLASNRTLPNGQFDPTPFDDSDTRRNRGAKWKPWYAHFLRLRVKPGTLIIYQARAQWRVPYDLGNGRRWTGEDFHGRCIASLR